VNVLQHSYQVHLESKQHKDNAFIIEEFVEHCSFRDVSPVACSVDELIFYLEAAFVRSKFFKQTKTHISINRVLFH
jgi:hypothetical protein